MSTFIQQKVAKTGLTTRDAKRNLVLHVTSGDVRRAKPRDTSRCAFACAAKRQDGKVRAAYFFRSTAWLETDQELVRYQLPISAQKEIVAFDRSGACEPGTYHLRAPRKTSTLSQTRARSKARRGRHQPTGLGTTRALRHVTTEVRNLKAPV